MFSSVTNSRPLTSSSFGTCSATKADDQTRCRIQYGDCPWYCTHSTQKMRGNEHCWSILYRNAKNRLRCTNARELKGHTHQQMKVDSSSESNNFKESSQEARNWTNLPWQLSAYSPSSHRHFTMHNHLNNALTPSWAITYNRDLSLNFYNDSAVAHNDWYY